MQRLVVAVVLLAACEREERREPSRPPESHCLADELGPLRDGWSDRRNECRDDHEACRRACELHDASACFSLGIVLQEDPAEKPATIADYFEHACREGLATGCTNWAAGQMVAARPPVEQGARRPSRRCLYRVFDLACAVGDTFGCSMTARVLLEWPRTPADGWIAYGQLMNACNTSGGPPCIFLAYYLERGDFGASDPARVKALLARACHDGYDEACGKETADDLLH